MMRAILLSSGAGWRIFLQYVGVAANTSLAGGLESRCKTRLINQRPHATRKCKFYGLGHYLRQSLIERVSIATLPVITADNIVVKFVDSRSMSEHVEELCAKSQSQSSHCRSI